MMPEEAGEKFERVVRGLAGAALAHAARAAGGGAVACVPGSSVHWREAADMLKAVWDDLGILSRDGVATQA